VLVGRAKAYAAACQQKYGGLLAVMTTANIARTWNRSAPPWGRGKLSYLGYSYGTYIGQVYATLFPSRVHRMVLDSIGGPDRRLVRRTILPRIMRFQGRMRAFLRLGSPLQPGLPSRDDRCPGQRVPGTRRGPGWSRTRSRRPKWP